MHMELMLKQLAETLHDAQLLAGIPFRIVDLGKLQEDIFQVLLWNSPTGIVELYQNMIATPAAGQKNAAPTGIFQGVVEQITQYAFQL